MHSTRLSRLAVLLEETTSKQKVELARKIRKSPAQISQWLSGYRSIGERAAREIEQAARKPVGWLDGLAPLDANTPTQVNATLGGIAQQLSHAVITVAPSFTWEQLMSQPVELPPEFHVTLIDDAMAPRAPAGAKVKLDTGRAPQPGDAVLCRAADGALYFREYRAQVGATWQAYATNPAYPSLISDAHGLQVLAVFVGIDIAWSALSR